MIIVAAYLLVLASVPLTGGSLARLAQLRLAAVWAVVVAMALQIFVVNIVEGVLPEGVAAALHLVSYGFAFWFAWANRHVVGVAVMVAGGLANLAAIAANGGVMPASAGALQAAGRPVHATVFQNSQAVSDARLWFLGDVFAWPDPLPLANVFSVGDLLLVAGAGMTLHSVCRSRPALAVARHRSRADLHDER